MNFKRKAMLGLAAIACAATPVFAQQGPTDVVQAHVDAYRAADIEAFLDTFASDAVLIFDGQRFTGRAQLRKAYAINFQAGAPSIYIAGSEVNGSEVVLWEGYTLADGTDVCCSVSTYTVQNGKIKKIEVIPPR
jgi:hypothetical protein